MSDAGRLLTCTECAERLYEYLDRELTPEWERDVAAHLDECADCFSHFEFERVFLELLARRGAVGASAALRARVLRLIRGHASPESG